MPGGGEDGHVRPGFGNDDVGDEAGNTGDAGEEFTGAPKGPISSPSRVSTRWRSWVWAVSRAGWTDVGAAGGLGEGGHAELGRVAALGDLVHFRPV